MWTQKDIEDIKKKAYKKREKEITEKVRNGKPAAITEEGII